MGTVNSYCIALVTAESSKEYSNVMVILLTVPGVKVVAAIA